jgi:UDP-N-acetylglucosamine:LPS N-acetylglucosamine transferase
MLGKSSRCQPWIAVAGRNDAMRHTLQSRHGYDQRVSVLGYTTRMRDLLCAADAFVTTTAGSSIQEARPCGVPTVCYGFLIGRVRDNVNEVPVALARPYAETTG